MKRKLDLTERQLVKEFAKRLVKESHDGINFTIDNANLDDKFIGGRCDSNVLDRLQYITLNGDKFLQLNGDDYDRFSDWAGSEGYDEGTDYWQVDKNGHKIDQDNLDKMESKKIKGKKIIKENNTYTMISALREVIDDLLLQSELLIDKQYGKLEHNVFKNMWYKNAEAFEKKYKVIIKSLMKAGQ